MLAEAMTRQARAICAAARRWRRNGGPIAAAILPDYRFAEVVSEIRHGPGARWHVRVKSDLPYTLDFNFTVLTHEPPRYVRTRVEGFFEGEIDWRLERLSPEATRMTLHEQTETKWALINMTARLGGRRLLVSNHSSAMRRGEIGLKAALARGYVPPDLDAPDRLPEAT
jgi:hypothetical protein